MALANASMPLPPDVNRGPTIAIVSWIVTAISTIFFALRLYTKLFIIRLPEWDDWILLFAVALNITAASLASVTIQYGLGRHIYYLTENQIVNILFYSVIAEPFGVFAYCIPKLAVVILIVRLMGPQKRGAYFLYSMIAVLFATSAASLILYYAQCDPPSHIWNPSEPANCWPASVWTNVTYAAGAWSAFTDFVLAVFPSTILYNLKMKKSRRIRLCIIMGLGVLATIAAIIKTTQVYHSQDADLTWGIYSLDITTCIETQLVIIAASAPVLPRLLEALRGKKRGGSSAQSDMPGSGFSDQRKATHDARAFGEGSDKYGTESTVELNDRRDSWA